MSGVTFNSQKSSQATGFDAVQPYLQYWSRHVPIEVEPDSQLFVRYDRGFSQGDHHIKIQKIFAEHKYYQSSDRYYRTDGRKVIGSINYVLNLKFEDEKHEYFIRGAYILERFPTNLTLPRTEFRFTKMQKTTQIEPPSETTPQPNSEKSTLALVNSKV